MSEPTASSSAVTVASSTLMRSERNSERMKSTRSTSSSSSPRTRCNGETSLTPRSFHEPPTSPDGGAGYSGSVAPGVTAAVVVFGDHLVCGNCGVGGQDGLVEFAEPFRADLESY